MIQKMNQVAADFRRASNKQMAETTKRTINENARIEQTVHEMEDVSTRVQNENDLILGQVGRTANDRLRRVHCSLRINNCTAAFAI